MTNLQKFQDLGLSEKTLKALEKKGFEEPSEIQSKIIPLLLANQRDIIGQSSTGSGKTAAFGLPLIERLKPEGYIQVLILVPTRELAIQVSEEINSLQSERKLRVIPVYGGQSYDIQLNALKRGVDIVVGTPGRVIDHINRRTLKVENISNLILDEADEMLNMGFVDDIEEILKSTNKDKRVLLFSATMPREILSVAKRYMKDYELVAIASTQMTATDTNQIYFEVAERDKLEALSRIIDMEPNFYGIVFCKTKLDVDFVSGKFIERGYQAQALHGDVQQKQRERILSAFKSKRTTILIATDVAARGIDIQDISHVINYSLPQDPESYVHRVGRTGRAGKKGTAITFVTPSEYKKIIFFQRVTKTDIKRGQIPNVANIIEMKKLKLKEKVNLGLENDAWKKYTDIASDLLSETEPQKLVACLLKIFYQNELDPNNYKDIQKVTIDTTGKSRLFIALGRNEGYTPSSLVDYITAETGVKGNEIDDVSVLESFSFITVSFVEAEIILQIFERKRSSGGRSLVSKAKEKDSSGGGRFGGGSRSGGSYSSVHSGGSSYGRSVGDRANSGISSAGGNYQRGGSSSRSGSGSSGGYSSSRSGGSSYGHPSRNYSSSTRTDKPYSSPSHSGNTSTYNSGSTSTYTRTNPTIRQVSTSPVASVERVETKVAPKSKVATSKPTTTKAKTAKTTTTDGTAVKPKRSIIKKIFGKQDID